MPFNDIYRRQAELLVRTLPYVADESCFALKGGTAINLFVRNLPRLSVDIDLTYLPIADRSQSLTAIQNALRRISVRLRATIDGVTVTESVPISQSQINKLIVRTPQLVQIKIEVTPVLRGCVYEPEMRSVCETVQDQFGFAEISVLSFADLYAGKVLATLDRQHPRDLFDIHHLLANEGINERMRVAIIVYLISHDHTPQTLLSPRLKDITQDYEQNFRGMTEEDFPLDLLSAARSALVDDILGNMPENHKRFLLSFYRRHPDWSLLDVDGVDKLPAVRWREINLDKAGTETCAHIVSELKKVLWQ